jgi:hypothetical protein
MSQLAPLHIPAPKGGARPSPQQKRFNTLVRQIDQARETLTAWNSQLDLYRQAHAGVILPLKQELRATTRQWVFALDALLDQKEWTKAQRETLRHLICENAAPLAAEGNDPELRALFDKHADIDFATGKHEMTLAMKALAEEVTGLDLGDDEGIDSEQALFERLRATFEQQAASEEARREARTARKGKTAAQQRRESEAQQATQSLREIYRKLASSLHPDRETDERERASKTEMMQRVNQAYAAGDLLGLLELQLRIEQIDASHVATASEARLKHYNQVLAGQLLELKAKIQDVELGWKIDFDLPPFMDVDPYRLGEVLRDTERACRGELARLRNELRMFAERPATKRWLKKQRERLEDEAFGLPF